MIQIKDMASPSPDSHDRDDIERSWRTIAARRFRPPGSRVSNRQRRAIIPSRLS